MFAHGDDYGFSSMETLLNQTTSFFDWILIYLHVFLPWSIRLLYQHHQSKIPELKY